MKNESRTQGQLLTEIDALRSRVQELESQYDPDLAEINRIFVETTNQGLVIFQDDVIVFANQAFLDLCGYTREELFALSSTEAIQLIHEDDRPYITEKISESTPGSDILPRLEHRLIRKNGEIRWVEPYVHVIEFRGKPAVQASYVDITQRKKAEQALQESERKFATVFDTSPDTIALFSKDQRYININPAFTRILGYSEEDVLGKTSEEIGLWVDNNDRKRMLAIMQKEGIVLNRECEFRTKSGEIRIMLVSVNPVDTGRNSYSLSVGTDITERKKAEQTLRESEEKFAAAFHASPDAMAITTIDGQFIEINDAFVDLFGYSRDEVFGKVESSFDPTGGNPEQNERLNEVIQKKGRIFSEECEFRTKSGNTLTVLFSLENITLAGKRYSLSVSTDITAHKQAEKALRESEEKFSQIFFNNPEMIIITHLRTGLIVDANQMAVNIIGSSREDIIGQVAADCVFYPDREKHERIKSLLEISGRVDNEEITVLSKNGEIFTFLLTGLVIDLGGDPCVIAVHRDITARIKAIEALRESEEKFSRIFQLSPDGMVILSDEGKYLDVNQAFSNRYGYTYDDIIGKTPDEIGAWVFPEERDRILGKMLQDGRVYAEEFHFRDKSGVISTVLMSAEIINLGGRNCVISVSTNITARVQTERALRESEEKFARAFHSIPVSVVITDSDGLYIDVNEHFCRDIGLPREALIGKSGLDVNVEFLPEHRDEIARRLAEDGSVSNLECQVNMEGKDTRTLLLSITPIVVAGNPCFLNISYDITDRKRAEQALLESEEKFATAFQASPDAMAIATEDDVFLEINDAFLSFYGYTRDEIFNADGAPFDPPENSEQRRRMREILERDGPVRAEEVDFQTRNGDIRTALFSMEKITLGGKPCRISVTIDITERKRTEKALADEAARRRILMDQSKDGIVILDVQGSVYEANQRFAQMLGYSLEEIYGLHVWDWDVQISRKTLRQMIGTVDEAGDHFETKHRRKDGTTLDVEISSNGAVFDNQKLVFCVCRDITDRKRAEQALQESEEKFATAFHSSPDAIVITDETGTYIDVNESFVRDSGYTREEVFGKRESDFQFFCFPEQRDEFYRQVIETNKISDYECQLRYRDGSIHTVLFSLKPIILNRQQRFLGVTHDITERKRAEEALRESEERFATAFHSSPNTAVIIRAEDRTYYEVNDIFCQITGYKREELIGHSVDDPCMWLNDEEQRRYQQELHDNGRVQLSEYQLSMKNSEVRTWLCSAEFITLHGETCLLSVASDITERIHAEEQLKTLYEQEARLRQKLEEEMKRRAEFTRALVHELKTPLTPIVASSDSLTAILSEEPMRSMALNVNRGALNLNKRIDELLELARSELNILRISPSLIDLSSLLRDIASEMGPMAEKHQQTLKLELPERLSPVQADTERIRQVIGNLVTNAVKFSDSGGQITLRARSTKKDVTIEVEDTGPGMDKKELERLFQPYYRKESDREHLSGLGLGLALCKTLIDQHGGKIWAESNQGKGSKFSFSLPIKAVKAGQ